MPDPRPHRHLPPEILDNILDLLRYDKETLGACCLVSKMFVPRSRKHLFNKVGLDSPGHLLRWKMNFSDPANSPAYYTTHLVIRCPMQVTSACVGEGGWVRSFSNVALLEVWNGIRNFLSFLQQPLIISKRSSYSAQHMLLEHLPSNLLPASSGRPEDDVLPQ